MSRFSINYLILLFFFLITLVISFSHINYLFDDSYIHFRIADNLLKYGKPYFNVNESYMSSSSSIWTNYITLLKFIFHNNFIYSLIILNSLTLTFNLNLYKKIVEILIKRKTIILENIFIYLVLFSIQIASSIGLMETILLLFFIGQSFILLSRNNIYGYVLIILALFIRYEAVVYLFYFIFYFRNNFKLSKVIFICFLSSIPVLCYDIYYFDTVFPLTIKAKKLVYTLSYSQVLKSLFFIKSYFLEFIILLTFFYNIYLKRFNIFFLIGLTVFLLYIYGKAQIFEWYKPIYLVPIFISFISLNFSIQNILYSRTRKLFLIGNNIIVILFTLFYLHYFFFAVLFRNPKFFPDFYISARVNKYIEISKDLYLKYPNSKLMTTEIGGIGFGFKGYIIDGMGLIQPDCLKYHPLNIPNERSSGSIGAIPTACVIEKMPEIIVSHDIFIEHFQKSQVKQYYNHYRLNIYSNNDLLYINNIYNPLWGSKFLNVYILKNIDKGL
jgi:hypothetical protein